MTLHTRRGASATTTGTTWTNTANAWDAGTATYAVWSSTVSGATATIDISGHNFAAVLAGTEQLASVTLTIRHLESNTTNIASVKIQPFDGSTAIGTALTLAKQTTARIDTATFPVTLAQLRSATFKVRVTITRAANTSAGTFSLDYVDVTAEVITKTETLTDTFETLDAGKWGSYGTATVEGGRAKLVSIQAYSGLYSLSKYDLRESMVFAKVTPPPAAGSRETTLSASTAGGTDGAFFGITSSPPGLMMRRRVANVNTDSFLGYDPVEHAWLRIRLVGTSLYWDTSPDGVTWTNRHLLNTTAVLSQVQVELSCGQWATEADTQPGYFDNLNVPGVAGGRPKVWNGSAWVAKPVKVWNGSVWVEKPMKVWNGSAWELV